jgi:hypothetical protein
MQIVAPVNEETREKVDIELFDTVWPANCFRSIHRNLCARREQASEHPGGEKCHQSKHQSVRSINESMRFNHRGQMTNAAAERTKDKNAANNCCRFWSTEQSLKSGPSARPLSKTRNGLLVNISNGTSRLCCGGSPDPATRPDRRSPDLCGDVGDRRPSVGPVAWSGDHATTGVSSLALQACAARELTHSGSPYSLANALPTRFFVRARLDRRRLHLLRIVLHNDNPTGVL